MGRIHFLSVLVLFAVFGSHLCQTKDGNSTTVSPSNVTTTTTMAPTTSSTTTIKPTPPPTTPAPVPTTTSAPAPVPTIITGNVTEGNYTCLRYEFTVHFNIKYNTTLNETKTALLQLPLNSRHQAPTGTCSFAKESFSLYQGDSLNFTLTFSKNENSVYLDSINLFVVYDNKTFPNVESSLLGHNHTYNLVNLSPNFNVEKSHSYLCANVTVPKNDDVDVQVVFSSLKLQAFMDKSKNGQFSSEHNCQNEINDVVPIAVGAALTGLVVIVLVAYFIGRRRSRRLAYQSV